MIKRQISFLMLAARSSLWRVLLALAVFGAAGTALFVVTFRATPDVTPPLEGLLDGQRLVLALELLVITAAVSLSGGGFGSRVDYTAARLPAPRWNLTLWFAVYGLVIYAIVWAFQLAQLLALCALYGRWAEPLAQNGQMTFLAAWRSGPLHSLLPLDDVGRWIATGLLYGGLGLSTATAAVRAQRGKWAVGPLVIAAATWFQPGGVGTTGWYLLLGAASLIVAGAGFIRMWEEEES